MHARGLYKPQATSEHDLHTNRFVSACYVHWYLSVPSTMEIATSSGLLRWLSGHRFGPLCGLAASRHSAFACQWHSTADTWNKISASSVLAGSRTHIESAWPDGPMVAVGHVRHNHKSIHCLNHSGGDNHRERTVRCGDLTSSLERPFCWHSDLSLDGESLEGARCRFHLRPNGEGEKTVG